MPRGVFRFSGDDAEMAEKNMLEFELSAAAEGYRVIAGIDEAGRGCCAGPVVAAAVVFTDHSRIPAGINDSKQLTALRRMELREQLLNDPTILYGIGEVSAQEIDSINILQATWKAMRLALEKIASADFALIDGNITRGFTIPCRAVVHGDATSPSIAAASILAKVTRDRICMELDEKYPQYGIAKHKGYGTKAHMDALREHGPCEIYRTKFIRFLDK